MKIAIGSDERTHLTGVVLAELTARGHSVLPLGALGAGPTDWPDVAHAVAASVVSRACDEGILFCWTGTGAAIAANKAPGIRAALCADAETARGARIWNHANVLVMSLRTTSEAVAREILDAWFVTPFSTDDWNVRQIAKLDSLEVPMPPAPASAGDIPVTVYVAANQLEAQVIRSLLESEGIPATLRYESVGLVYGLTVDGMGETRVLVPARLQSEAERVISLHQSPPESGGDQ
jgi:ribose 5-phosphate isomerase B